MCIISERRSNKIKAKVKELGFHQEYFIVFMRQSFGHKERRGGKRKWYYLCCHAHFSVTYNGIFCLRGRFSKLLGLWCLNVSHLFLTVAWTPVIRLLSACYLTISYLAVILLLEYLSFISHVVPWKYFSLVPENLFVLLSTSLCSAGQTSTRIIWPNVSVLCCWYFIFC